MQTLHWTLGHSLQQPDTTDAAVGTAVIEWLQWNKTCLTDLFVFIL